jgi:hypothetical protein
MTLPTALLLITLECRLPWLVALVVLWPHWWPWLCRTCRRVLCRLTGGHAPVLLGVHHGTHGVEIWHACRVCDWCSVDHVESWPWDESPPVSPDDGGCS